MKEDKEKNFLLIQDINTNEKNLSYKIFGYFYSLYQIKRQMKSYLKHIQIFIETIQFISFIFSSIHYNSWKLQLSHIRRISNIVGLFRLSNLIYYLNYDIFSIILYAFIIIIFLLCLIVIVQILFMNPLSKRYQISKIIISSIIDILTIILYIPITEIILMPIKCINLPDNDIFKSKICMDNTIYLNMILGIIGAILLFIWCIFMINFSFYPFQKIKSTIRINSNNDIIIIIMKLIIILQYLFITNEYISLAILLFASLIMFVNCFYEPTYNRKSLENVITIKNLIILWSYFVLLLSKLFKNFNVNGFIYLLVYGYPLIIIFSCILSKEKIYQIHLPNNPTNSYDFIKKARLNIKLIDTFIERNQNMRIGNENDEQQYLILLKGNIEFHTMTCTNKDCPLIKFINNEGNFNIQRQCLLNYMNIFFNIGLKKFPKNVYLLILHILFNYSKGFNLNSVKINLSKLKKIKCSIKDKFIIYFMEQSIKDINGLNYNNVDKEDSESQVDLSEQKYQKLKYLIENSIKLYAEFWGVFSTNITSMINTNKLYTIGEKLNIYLNEINNLWDNELKNKKISSECQNIIQLYSKFLLEILWDRKKSKEISKKLNDEYANNFNLNDDKKIKKEKKNSKSSIESLLDNQDYLLFCDYDEKGNSKIVQCSLSFSQLLGYQKYDLIGKYFDIIFPNILIEENLNYLEECIKSLHNEQNNQKELYQENESDKNKKLIIIKSKMGYIFTLFSSFKILNGNDYSDSFLVKIKIERKESKSEYAYYILTNSELNIENISSSAINLGLSLDLLKKYVVKMDILVRTENNKILNIYDDYNKYEDEPKLITWVFPNIIYPKDNNKIQNKDEEIDELVEQSNKKKFYLQIKPIKFNNTNIAFVFKFTEIDIRKNYNKFNNEIYMPGINKNLIMFDLLNLNYIRTLLVDKKSGLRNLRNTEEEKNVMYEESNILNIKKNKKRKKSSLNETSDEETEKNKKNNILTKEKIIELQGNSYLEIKDFIFSLPMYGLNIALERFRPNGDRYSASKITEPSIKIQISNFCKRIEEKNHLIPNLKHQKNKNISIINNNINSPKFSNTNNYLFSSDANSSASSTLEISEQKSDFQKDEINKGITSDTSSSLSNIFKSNSINYIKILINFVFIETFLLILFIFLFLYKQMNIIKKKNRIFLLWKYNFE